MKHGRIILYLVALCTLLLFALSAVGQEQAPPQDQPRQRQMPTIQERLDRMAKELNLTDDQKAKIKTIMEENQKKMQDARQEMQSMSPEDRRAKMQEMRTKSNDAIKAVLNDEQKKKFDEMNQRGPGGGGPRPGGPPPPGF